MRWPAVPPFIITNQSFVRYIKNPHKLEFPRKRVPMLAVDCGTFNVTYARRAQAQSLGKRILLKDLDWTQSPFAATRQISIEGCEGPSIAGR